MSDYPSVIIAALIEGLLTSFAPAMLAADAVCKRAAGNPGLASAQHFLADWLADLRHGEHADALAPERLSAALRAFLVRAISRGSVKVGGHPDHGGPVLLLAAEDLAALELVREMAVTLDAANGASVAAAFDEYREDTLDRVFALVSTADRARR